MKIMSLTEQQGEKLLKRLQILPEFRKKLCANPREFLFEIDRRFKQFTHYETITWGSKPLDQLQPPSIEDSVELILKTGGGACLQLNYTLHLLLKYLGFDTFVIACQMVQIHLPRNHILVVVKLLKSEQTTNPGAVEVIPGFETHDIYLMDAARARPFAAPVLLNDVPQDFKAAGFIMKLNYNESIRKFEVFARGGDPIRGPYKDPGYEKFYEFDLTPLQFEDFNDDMGAIFTDPSVCYFLNTVLLSRYLEIRGKDDYLFVNFMGRTLTVMTSEGWVMAQERFEKYMDMMPGILEYFPMLSRDALERALMNYEQRQLKHKQQQQSAK